MTDSLRDDIVKLTTDMIRFRGTADCPDQLAATMEYITDYLDTIPGLFCHQSESNDKPAVLATLHNTRAPMLMLNGHIDVVAAQPEQFTPHIREGRIYGRGSQDMKGSVAAMLRLFKELAALEPRPNVGLQIVSDEEIGGADGTERLVHEGWLCQMCIAGEPTNMHICYEQKGGIWMEMSLAGAPAHASRPWDGRNPLFDLGTGLHALQQRFPVPPPDSWQTTVTPTLVQAGTGARNQVPPHVTLSLDVRRVPEDDPDAIVAAVRECFPSGAIDVQRLVVPLLNDPQAVPIQQLVTTIEEVRKQPTHLYREHFGSDARFYSAVGVPSVCFGPVGAGLHSDTEWVSIDSLLEFYAVLRAYATAYAPSTPQAV